MTSIILSTLTSRVSKLRKYFPIAYFFMALVFIAVPSYIGFYARSSAEPILATTLLFLTFSTTMSVFSRPFIFLYWIIGLLTVGFVLKNSEVVSHFYLIFIYLSFTSFVILLTTLHSQQNRIALRNSIEDKAEKSTWLSLLRRLNHEINNPLAIILGNNQRLLILLSKLDDNKVSEDAKKILTKTDKSISRIIQCQKILRESSEKTELRDKILNDEYIYVNDIQKPEDESQKSI